MTKFDCGFSLSHKQAKREVININHAFHAYADCDPRCELEEESYLSAFHFDSQFANYLKEHQTTKNYNGPCWSPFLWFDIDNEELSQAHAETIKLVKYLRNAGGVVLIFFSGKKGYHVGLNTDHWKPKPSDNFHQHCKAMATTIAESANVERIDISIYAKVQPLRSPNSRHPDTGLHKRQLSPFELESYGIEQIKELATKPERFSFHHEVKEIELFHQLWEQSRTEIKKLTTLNKDPRKQGTEKLNLKTMEFIRGGAGHGDRHRLLFSAAANLAEFDCPPDLAHALLIDPAMDCGLTYQDAKRQIVCGLQKGKEHELHISR